VKVARAQARDLVAAAVLVGIVVMLFWDSIFEGRVLFERDINQLYWGQAETFVRCIFSGSWPVWDPLAGFGQPMLANPSTQVLYPWTWLNLLMSPTHFYTLFACSHLVFSGLGLYVYGRSLGLSRASSLASATLWTAGGPFLSMVSLWHHFASAAWIPWVLLAVDRVLTEPTLAWAARLGLLVALQILAGSADMMVATGLLLLGSTTRHWSGTSLALAGRRVGALALAFGLSLGLTAALLLPAIEVLRASDRAGLPEAARGFWSLHPIALLQVVIPVFPHLLPLSDVVRAELYDSREPFLTSVYLGLAALPLVLAAFLGRWRRPALAFAVTAVLAVFVALGRFGPFYGVLTTLMPPLRSLRYPVKAMIVPALAWALLAGFGMETLRVAAPRRSDSLALRLCGLAVALVALLSAFVFLGPDTIARTCLASTVPAAETLRSTGWALAAAALFGAAVVGLSAQAMGHGLGVVAAILTLVAADVCLAHRRLNPTADLAAFAPPPALDRLRADHATRIYAFDYLVKVLGRSYRRPDPSIPWADAPLTEPASLSAALAWQAFLGAPVAARWGLAGSFDSDLLGLRPRPLRNLGLYFRSTEETPAFVRLLRIGAVSHVVALHTEALENLRPLATEMSLFAGPVHLFGVPGALPRAYAVSGARIAEGLSALQSLADPAFDPEREVVLAVGSPVSPRPGFKGRVDILRMVPDRVLLKAELSESGYVVLVEAHDRGWRTSVDGTETPLLRANVAFRAVSVPAGRHRIEFLYRPPAALAGVMISGGALALAFALASRKSRRDSRHFPWRGDTEQLGSGLEKLAKPDRVE
jgi:Bacterial membrane protein YfhO